MTDQDEDVSGPIIAAIVELNERIVDVEKQRVHLRCSIDKLYSAVHRCDAVIEDLERRRIAMQVALGSYQMLTGGSLIVVADE